MVFRVNQYHDFVDGYRNHLDQGLKTCEKKLKKDPSNTLYLLAQADFLWKLKRYDEALKCVSFLKFSPNDQLESELVQEVQYLVARCQRSTRTFNYAAGPSLSALWKQALDRCSPMEALKIRSEMFKAAWRDEYWDLMQQLFSRLQKEFPQKPQYHFAWIACAHIGAQAMPQNDKMAQSLKLLAYRSLKAVADNTLNRKDTPRRITVQSQLRLLSQIYEAQGYRKELVQLLHDPTIEEAGSVSQSPLEFLRFELAARKSAGQYEDLYQNLTTTLQKEVEQKAHMREHLNVNSNTGDSISTVSSDWYLWSYLVDLPTDRIPSSAMETIPPLIHKYIDQDDQDRNAYRAYLVWHSKHKRAELLSAVLRYFDINCTRRSCFGDLKEFLRELTHPEEDQFLRHIDSAAQSRAPWSDSDQTDRDTREALKWVATNVNALKFEYFFCISKDPLPTKDSLEQFVSDALRMYKLALEIDKECGDETCILAVMALAKLNHFSRDFELDEGTGPGSSTIPKQAYLVQAFCLLDFLRTNSPHNYSAALLFVLIGQMLGITSLAASGLAPLNIKEVQHDSIGHLYWSRISISHPYDSTVIYKNRRIDDYVKPADGLNFAINWFENASDRTTRFISSSLDSVPFDKLIEFDQFRRHVEGSFSRALFLLEERRIARITGDPQWIEGQSLPPTFEKMSVDNRDFATIPSFEYHTTQPFEHFVVTQPKPNKYWIARQAVNDILWTLLYERPPYEAHQLHLLDESLKYLADNAHEQRYQLTDAEQIVSAGWDLIRPLICFLILGPSDPRSSKNAAADLAKLAKWINDNNPSPPDVASLLLPQSDVVQSTFLHLEFLRVASIFATRALELAKQKTHSHVKSTLNADKVQQLRGALTTSHATLQQHAGAWRARLQSSTGGAKLVTELLGASVTGEDVSELLVSHEAWNVQRVVAEIVESAVDTVDGLLKVRL